MEVAGSPAQGQVSTPTPTLTQPHPNPNPNPNSNPNPDPNPNPNPCLPLWLSPRQLLSRLCSSSAQQAAMRTCTLILWPPPLLAPAQSPLFHGISCSRKAPGQLQSAQRAR